jgi:uncharacterized peroxidase-related enzyme
MKDLIAASAAALLSPADPGGVGLAERAAIARRVATGDADVPDAIRAQVDRVAHEPRAATKAHLVELSAAGLSTRDIVTIHQLVAFTAFQVRINAGREASQVPTVDLPDVPFTVDELLWLPWLDTVDPGNATPEQAAALDESGRTARQSPYYLTLAHDPASLRARSALYNKVMYGRGGLPRPDRELAATVVSQINGCVYCASVHGRRYVQLARRPEVIDRLFADGPAALSEPRQRAIADVATALTVSPVDGAPVQDDLTDDEYADLVAVTALFAWANRLMLTLGERRAAR